MASSQEEQLNENAPSQSTLLNGCCLYEWKNVDQPRAVVLIYHGFLAHANYPTVRYAAELLQKHNYAVLAADLPGHGSSPGRRGYLKSAEALIKTGMEIAQHARNVYATSESTKIPLFLLGSSMGGTIALSVAQELGDVVTGVVLLAPMLSLDVSAPARILLQGLSYLIPTVALIPSSATSSEKQYRDPAKRKECETDPLSISGSHIYVASAYTCVTLAQRSFTPVSCPIFCAIGAQDVVVKNQGAIDLIEKCKSRDKVLQKYEALHGLLCEPSPLVDEIQNDILTWLNERCS